MENLLLTIDPGTVDWSRAQFALTAIYHWLFVPLTLGLAVIMGIVNTELVLSSGVQQPVSGSVSSVLTSQWALQRVSFWSSNSEQTGAITLGLWVISSVHHLLLKASWRSLWSQPSLL